MKSYVFDFTKQNNAKLVYNETFDPNLRGWKMTFEEFKKEIEAYDAFEPWIINNDLKYGYGISHWTLTSQDNKIVFQMLSNTNWNQEKVQVGNGHITILKRVEALRINFSDKIEDGKYFAELKMPEIEIV